jgi:hypothetical protein
MRKTLVRGTCVSILVFGVATIAEGEMPIDPKELSQMPREARDKALWTINEDQYRLEESLIREFAGATDPDAKIAAAYLLGMYRVSRSATLLASEIGLTEQHVRRTREWLWDLHPVAEALEKIGAPAIPALLENLATMDEVEVRRLSLRTLSTIEGIAAARSRLEQRIATTTDAQQRSRLLQAFRTLSSEQRTESP